MFRKLTKGQTQLDIYAYVVPRSIPMAPRQVLVNGKAFQLITKTGMNTGMKYALWAFSVPWPFSLLDQMFFVVRPQQRFLCRPSFFLFTALSEIDVSRICEILENKRI